MLDIKFQIEKIVEAIENKKGEDIKEYDIANGEGVRVSLFVSGCTHACKGCFNEDIWDFRKR